MKINKLQFAVVREDPEIESYLLKRSGKSQKILLIGSGGCTALTLQCQYPKADITVLDSNLTQINLIKEKVQMLSHEHIKFRSKTFGIGIEHPKSLNCGGNFESLFRCLRDFIYEFVYSRENWLEFFNNPDKKIDFNKQVFNSKYWPVAFKLFLSDELLLAMFGKNAIQYAQPSSYSDYFRKIYELGLQRSDAKTNYFLHHLLLGHYLNDQKSLPLYLIDTSPVIKPFDYIEASILQAPKFNKFDVISLSNILDWMDIQDIHKLIARLSKEMKAGAWLVYRQLNNDNDYRKLLGSNFIFEDTLAFKLLKNDRSLFYSGLHIAQKN